jgi:hypothetical protein
MSGLTTKLHLLNFYNISNEYMDGLQLFGFFTYLQSDFRIARMQRLLTILFLLLAQLSMGQKYDLFEVEGEELFWRHTYEYEGSADSIRRVVVALLKSKMFTQNIIRNEAGYNGELRHYQVNCKKYGRTYANTPRIYWDGEWSGKIIVEIKDSRYRVSIYALYFENSNQPSSYYRNQNPRKGFYVKEVLRKNKTGFKKNVLADMALMSLALKDEFDIRKLTLPTGDW